MTGKALVYARMRSSKPEGIDRKQRTSFQYVKYVKEEESSDVKK